MFNFFSDKNEIAKIIETIIDDILPKDNSTNPDANDTLSHTDSMVLSSISTSTTENGPKILETNCTRICERNCKIEKRDAIGETKSQEDLSRQEYTRHCKMVMGLYIDKKKLKNQKIKYSWKKILLLWSNTWTVLQKWHYVKKALS